MSNSKRRWRRTARQAWRSEQRRLPRFCEPFDGDVLVWREASTGNSLGVVYSNIVRTCVEHSPDGYECGYSGSGPADLALSILNAFVPPRRGKLSRWTDEPRHDDPLATYRGVASRFALEHHQQFKVEFIASMDRNGGRIPAARIHEWIAQHGGVARVTA